MWDGLKEGGDDASADAFTAFGEELEGGDECGELEWGGDGFGGGVGGAYKVEIVLLVQPIPFQTLRMDHMAALKG